MERDISNSDDVIDSRDVIKRISDLEDHFTEEHPEEKLDAQAKDCAECQELIALRALAEEGEGSPDWPHGETLIRESYFKDYAQELAEDIGAINKDANWPNDCIDWDKAADELRVDYMAVDYDGVTYYIRA